MGFNLLGCQSIRQERSTRAEKARPQVIVERTDSGKFKIRISKSGGQLTKAEIQEIVSRYIGNPTGPVPYGRVEYQGANTYAKTPAFSSFDGRLENQKEKKPRRARHQSYALELSLNSMTCDSSSSGTSGGDIASEEGSISKAICSATQSDGLSLGGGFEFYVNKWLAVALGVNYRSSDLNESVPISEFTIDDSSYSLNYDILLKPRYMIRSSMLDQMNIEGIILEVGAGFTLRNVYTKLKRNTEDFGDGEISDYALKYMGGVKVLLRSGLYAGFQYSTTPEIDGYEVCVSGEEIKECLSQEQSGLPKLPGITSLGLNLGYIF